MRTICNWMLAALLLGSLAACDDDDDGPPVVNIAAPTITVQPAATTVQPGATATFSVVATGTGDLAYQWLLNGADISGATSASYVTAVTAAADNGKSYTVRVSNPAGSVVSSAAVLTVSTGSVPADNVATATDLANQADAAIAAAEAKSQAPGGIQLQTVVPTGVVTTVACGTGSFTYDAPSTFTAGTTYSFTYNNCSYGGGYVFNGSYVITYSSFVDASNFAWTITYNLSYTGPNSFNYTYSGSQTCSYAAGNYSCTYFDGTRNFQSNFTYSGGTINGSYSWTYSSYGSYVFTFNNWTATSGSVSVTGPNNFSATIVRTSATTYTVTINGGSPYTITVSH